MGSFDRSKKRIQPWKRALFHFSLCFFMGFFMGFAPSGTTSIFSSQVAAASRLATSPGGAVIHTVEARRLNSRIVTASTTLAPEGAAESPVDASDVEQGTAPAAADANATSTTSTTATTEGAEPGAPLTPRRLLILITTTRVGDPLQDVLLGRLGSTLRLVPPPLLWVVVESHGEAPRTAEMLRRTGVMYRHLVFRENFTAAPAAEADHQRNVALSHIENHRLDGIVHFAGLSHVYDLRFFDMIRETEVFGAWPVASVYTNRKRVALEGPVCRSSRLAGWRLLKDAAGNRRSTPKIDVSSFAFNSSILWDPERWGRPTSLPDISQDSIKFVQEVVLQDEGKLKAMPPPDCTRVLMWRLHVSRRTLFSRHSTSPPVTGQTGHRRR